MAFKAEGPAIEPDATNRPLGQRFADGSRRGQRQFLVERGDDDADHGLDLTPFKDQSYFR